MSLTSSGTTRLLGGIKSHMREHHPLLDLAPFRKAVESLAQRFLFLLPAEWAHDATVRLLARTEGLLQGTIVDDDRLSVTTLGLHFRNPIGVAAGVDKDAECFSALLSGYGFGFCEVGTVTPKPQLGNAKPRVFRLRPQHAIINRFGFNSDGHAAMLARLARHGAARGIVGVNVGANKESSDRAADYVAGIVAFAPVASYFTVNVSSPNTPGLRDLQQAAALDDLLARVMEARAALAPALQRPILLKIAPDLTLGDLDNVVAVARQRGVDGMIVANTTVTRPPDLRDTRQAQESGGLSGRPLFALSTRMLAETFVRVEGAFPLIGVGGIDSGATALAKIRAGATLLQLYSALVFHGLGLVADIKRDLLRELDRTGAANLAKFVGADATARTAEPSPG